MRLSPEAVPDFFSHKIGCLTTLRIKVGRRSALMGTVLFTVHNSSKRYDVLRRCELIETQRVS